ncbi:McrC family protein [Jeotgalibaca sp. MA1X17-3]|uniref:McrC family protein n=1 Tax=Jeotgalibaca sp. MA1X17-3 TaxID=2908211 RepID=UPI001F31C74C|nr:McrC family protein [Jeotgalibaca sp. MA1X17-3]UJF16603.1 McrC family protein [Jeotgalibaca sp. MA1X17-3]
MRNRNITVKEYDRIYINQVYCGVSITKRDIEELREAIDEQNTLQTEDTPLGNFLKPIRGGVQVNNYVGVLQTKSGLAIEILPKIYSKEHHSTEEIQNLFWKMITTVKDIDGKVFQMSHLDVKKANLLEIFISMFLIEIDIVIKKGLKSSYITVQENKAYLKGKLLMKQQVQCNMVNASKFYSEFDEFLLDSPENIILRKCMEFILKVTQDRNNYKYARELFVHFDNISPTSQVDLLFKKVHLGRSHLYYKKVLAWSEIFLKGYSFTTFTGSSLAFAILFPMEKVFESYIVELIKSSLPEMNTSFQEQSLTLFDQNQGGQNTYRLRPDIVARSKNHQVVIGDTKWKVLTAKGPVQSDLYQMYAYFTRYSQSGEDIKKVILIYPYSDAYQEGTFSSYKEDELTARIEVRYINLFNPNLKQVIREMFLDNHL